MFFSGMLHHKCMFLPPVCVVELTTLAVRLQHFIHETLEDFAAYIMGKNCAGIQSIMPWYTVITTSFLPCLRVSLAHACLLRLNLLGFSYARLRMVRQRTGRRASDAENYKSCANKEEIARA